MTCVIYSPTSRGHMPSVIEITQERSAGKKRCGDVYKSILAKLATLAEDSDEIGADLESQEILQLAATLPASYDNDVVKEIISHFACLEKYDASAYRAEIKKLREESSEKKEKSKKKRASQLDYFKLFLQRAPRRDLISGELMHHVDGEWRPVKNSIGEIYSGALYDSETGGPDFNRSDLKDHLDAFEAAQEKELLINIPEWDGIDRIEQIADVVKCSNVPQDAFTDLIKQFGATIFKRVADPFVQPITPIFQGAQGVGKDTLINALCGGFDFYFVPLSLSHRNPEDTLRQLHRAIVFNISEFDRAARADVASLKHILSTDSTFTRQPYAVSAERKVVRASFIASANVTNLIGDSTGARRFWIFKIETGGFNGAKVEKIYPGHFADPNFKANRAQILAQFKHLADTKFVASDTSLAIMGEEISGHIPLDNDELILEKYDELIWESGIVPSITYKNIPYYTTKQLDSIIDEVCRKYDAKRKTFMSLLVRNQRQYRNNGGRYYCGSKENMRHDDSSPF